MSKQVIVGVDVGYSDTKICTGDGNVLDKIKSTVVEGDIDINKNSTVIKYEGVTYTIGENKGRQVFETKKMEDINFALCLMASFARTIEEDRAELDVVTGLPIAYYKAQKEELKSFLKNRRFKFEYNGVNKDFLIKNVEVFPQSAGLPLLHPEEFDDKSVLIIDIGGFTVDVSLFEDKRLVSYNSYPKGVLMFQKELAKAINSKYSTRYDFQDIVSVIRHGIIINEEKTEDSDEIIDKHFRTWVQSILDDVVADFPYDSVHSRTFIGGGALAFQNYLPKTKSIRTDEVYANAEAFYNVGVQLFG